MKYPWIKYPLAIVSMTVLGLYGGLKINNLIEENRKNGIDYAVFNTDMGIIESAMGRVNKIEYKRNNKWLTLEETVSKNTGDCNEMARLLKHLLNEKGIHVKLIVGKQRVSDELFHAWCEGNQWDKNGKRVRVILEATNGNVYYAYPGKKVNGKYDYIESIFIPDEMEEVYVKMSQENKE